MLRILSNKGMEMHWKRDDELNQEIYSIGKAQIQHEDDGNF